MNSSEKKLFWSRKILDWEKSRYTQKHGILKRHINSSVLYRLNYAKQFLLKHCTGKHITELGCGTALLLEDLLSSQTQHYYGFDFATPAIELLKQRYSDNPKVSLSEKAITQIESLNTDIVFSLGLLDWLDLSEIDHLFKISNNAHFFHTISEKRPGPTQLIHKLYVYVFYGHKSQGYTPQYYSVDEIFAIAQKYTNKKINIIRDPRLRFGTIITTLDNNDLS